MQTFLSCQLILPYHHSVCYVSHGSNENSVVKLGFLNRFFPYISSSSFCLKLELLHRYHIMIAICVVKLFKIPMNLLSMCRPLIGHKISPALHFVWNWNFFKYTSHQVIPGSHRYHIMLAICVAKLFTIPMNLLSMCRPLIGHKISFSVDPVREILTLLLL